MVQLSVRLDTQFYDQLSATARGMMGEPAELARRLAKAVSDAPFLASERSRILPNLEAWFDLAAMAAPDGHFWRGQQAMREGMEAGAAAAAAALQRLLPTTGRTLRLPMTVHLVPGFLGCYGSEPLVQVFGLRTGAEPSEALLFLKHVYYHEAATAFYTAKSRRVSEDQTTASRLRHWILLLVQNEGLANYAVLDELERLVAAPIEFKYFTYARLVGDRQATQQAMRLLGEVLTVLNDRTVDGVRTHLNALLKNPKLPIINLVGIHLARSIARRHGRATLWDSVRCDPQRFFSLFATSGDRLARCFVAGNLDQTPSPRRLAGDRVA